ncbi:Acetyl-coenzyme A transferase nodX [Paramyrothecium foliicola]|nr:Acetyl-coenzyme A transferase nodX [Paramyrothecium foliicola]
MSALGANPEAVDDDLSAGREQERVSQSEHRPPLVSGGFIAEVVPSSTSGKVINGKYRKILPCLEPATWYETAALIMDNYNVQDESRRILRDIILKGSSLSLDPALHQAVDKVEFLGNDSKPFIPTPCKITESASALTGLVAAAASAVAADRYGIGHQNVEVNTDLATLFLESVILPSVGGESFFKHPGLMAEIGKGDLHDMSKPIHRYATNVYKTRDNRFYHLHASLNATPTMSMMGVTEQDATAEQAIQVYAEKVAQHDAADLERRANDEYRQAGVTCLTPDEFFASEHGKAIAAEPLWSETAIPAPKSSWPATDVHNETFKPLEGIRVIDFSRIIAAPVISKMLGLLGADVIKITNEKLSDFGMLWIDLSTGKRDANIDLKTPEGKDLFAKLVEGADVLIDGYRPGVLERLGFDSKSLRAINSRMIYVRENCYGFKGPLAYRSGWQQISDCLVGISWLQGQFLGLDEPVVPLLPNSDYQVGLTGAAAVLNALLKRTKTNVTFDIDVSLTQYNIWYYRLGQYTEPQARELLRRNEGFSVRHWDEMSTLLLKTSAAIRKSRPDLFTHPEFFWKMSGKDWGIEEDIHILAPAFKLEKSTLEYTVPSGRKGIHSSAFYLSFNRYNLWNEVQMQTDGSIGSTSTAQRRVAKRKANSASTIDTAERKRTQNRISQQCLREKNQTYIRDLENTVQLLQQVAGVSSDGAANTTATQRDDADRRYAVLLEAHLKLIKDNRRLVEAALRLRKKLLSISNSAAVAAEDEIFASLLSTSTGGDDHDSPSEGQLGSAPVPETQVDPETAPDTSNRDQNPDNNGDNDASMRHGGAAPESFQAKGAQTSQLDDQLDLSYFFLAGEPLLTLDKASSLWSPQLPFASSDALFMPVHSSALRPSPSGRQTIAITSPELLYIKLMNACRHYLGRQRDWESQDVAKIGGELVSAASRVGTRCLGLSAYVNKVGGHRHLEAVMSWRLGWTSKDKVPSPFRPTTLQSRSPQHPLVFDIFNWPDIRDQLVLDEQSVTDADALTRDLLLHSVIEQPQLGVAVNVVEAVQGSDNAFAQKNFLTDPSWILFEVDPESQRTHGNIPAGCDPVEAALIVEIIRDIQAHSNQTSAETEPFLCNPLSRAPDAPKMPLPGLNDLGQWKLSKQFAEKYPWLDCSSVGAFIVYRFLRLHDRLFCDFVQPTTRSRLDEKQIDLKVGKEAAKKPQSRASCTLKLTGLNCASCAADIQSLLGKTQGTLEVAVSFILSRALVAYDACQTSEKDIMSVIRAAGYNAQPMPQDVSGNWAQIIPSFHEPFEERNHQLEVWKRSFTLSVTASLIAAGAQVVLTRLPKACGGPMASLFSELLWCVGIILSLFTGSRLHMETFRSLWALQRPGMSTFSTMGLMFALLRGILLGRATDAPGMFYHDAFNALPILTTAIIGNRLLKVALTLRALDFGTPLASLIPETALILRQNCETRVQIDMVVPGDRILAKQGEQIPADGYVDSIEPALITEAWWDGSLAPRAVNQHDTVLAGSRVEQGQIVMVAESCGKSTRLGQMLESVTLGELQGQQSDGTVMMWFVRAIIASAATILTGHIVSGNSAATWADITSRLSVIMLVVCPCAFGLSIPICMLLLTVRASKAGIRLVTSYSRVGQLAAARTILFDKTGTLTTGKLEIAHLELNEVWTTDTRQRTLWRLIGELEAASCHPVARLLVSESQLQRERLTTDLGPPDLATGEACSNIVHEVGRGVSGTFVLEGISRRLALGSRNFIESLGVTVCLASVPTQLRSNVTTPIIIAIDECQVGVILVEDKVRPEARLVVQNLKAMGLNVGMITGDNPSSARIVASRIGIDTGMAFAGLSPDEKAGIVQTTKCFGPTVVFGDGLNDLVGFSASSFSIYMDRPGALSVDSQGVADASIACDSPLQKPGKEQQTLSRVIPMFWAARQTVKIVAQNLLWTVLYNAITLIWAAGLITCLPEATP